MQLSFLDALPSPRWPSPAVAIGNFDGVHRGHRALADAVVGRVRERGGTAIVLSFDPHPARVLRPDGAPATLYTLAQRAEILGRFGVDVLAVQRFDAALSSLSAEAFVRSVLVERLSARFVVVGESFRFGRGRGGDLALLRSEGERHGFDVAGLPPVTWEGSPASSSRVREALAAGEVRVATGLLDRAFHVDGEVVHGEGRGRTIGVPTANLAVENETRPAHGVYVGHASWEGAPAHDCVVNIGLRPTFGGLTTSVEAHLLDFDGDLYGLRLRVAFLERLRAERRFPGPAALVAQIREDISRARATVAGYTAAKP
jgi:riboflavin kinase / FMN adenylyltransferase